MICPLVCTDLNGYYAVCLRIECSSFKRLCVVVFGKRGQSPPTTKNGSQRCWEVTLLEIIIPSRGFYGMGYLSSVDFLNFPSDNIQSVGFSVRK